MNFLYTKTPESNKPIIVVNKHIGYDEENGEGIIGTQFMDEVFELKRQGITKGDVWVNSPGGSMMEGYNICAGMTMSGVEFDTLNYGIAASSSGWIWLKGKKARMTTNAIFMCHNPSDGSGSNGSEQETFKNSVAVMISEGSGRNGKPKLTIEEAEKMMNETTFLDAEQCYNLGLCDEVLPQQDYENYKPVTTNDFYLYGNKIYNSLLKPKTMNLNEITNSLDLHEGANESVIAKSIASLKAKANRVDVLESTNSALQEQVNTLNRIKNEKEQGMVTAVNEMEDLKNKINAIEGQYNALMEEKNSLANKLNEMGNLSKQEAEAKMEADCRNMVNSFSNRIGSDESVVSDWVNTAKVLGFEKTKNMLAQLPVVGKAPAVTAMTFKVDVPGAKTNTGSYCNDMMQELRNAKEQRRSQPKITSLN